MVDDLGRLTRSVRGQPHERNLQRWRMVTDRDDVAAVERLSDLIEGVAGELSQFERTELA